MIVSSGAREVDHNITLAPANGRYEHISYESNDAVYIQIDLSGMAVEAGMSSSFAIHPDGSLWAWGSNTHGQLGDGTRINRVEPVKILDDVIAVSAGSSHTLAIKADGSLWAWGLNQYNQAGVGDSSLRAEPSIIIPGEG